MKAPTIVALIATWFALIADASRPLFGAIGASDSAAVKSAGVITGRVQHLVTGRFLNNARVSIRHTDLVALTDESGSYRIAGAPAGTVVLEVFYTGLDPQQISLNVPAGRSVEQDIGLTSAARYGGAAETVRLDPFVVSTARETDATAIAINERRFAGNPKDVISTDAFGDITGGNIGEFMKSLPGVLPVDGGGSEVNNVSLRGLPANLTVFTNDGAQMAGANTAGDSRTADVSNISINNVSRVEVIKSPLPSTRADSLAGTVNLVSKSAFERSRAEFRYRFHLTSNDQYFSFQRTPDTLEENTYKVYPGFDFEYAAPITRDFGFVVSGLHSQILTASHALFRDYNATASGTGASYGRPFLYNLYNRGPSLAISQRDSLSVKADWRLRPNTVLSVSLQTSYNTSTSSNIQFTQSTGTNGAPTPTTGTPLSYGPDFTAGATGRGSATLPSTLQGIQGAATAANISYRFNDGRWKIDAGLGRSAARKSTRQTARGYFNGITVGLKMPVRISFSKITPDSATISAFDVGNREIDIYDINNYQITAATTAPRDIRDEVQAYNLDVRRQISAWSFPVALQIGGSSQAQERETQRQSDTWTYRGPNGDSSAAPYSNRIFRPEVYNHPGLYYNQGAKIAPIVSPLLAWRAFEKSPDLFYQTPAQVLASEQARRVNAFKIKETVSAAYFQAELRFLKDRLNVITGVRFEKTVDDGLGVLQDSSVVFVRNADGSFAHNTAGTRIRTPEAGAAGSIEEMRLVYTRLGYHGNRAFDGWFPSLHLRYNLSENVLARASYAKAYGRPDFSNIIPNTVSNEADVADPNQVPQGTLRISNTGLRPWYADCFDLSLEYYTPQGGVFSAGAYLKEIKDFFGTFSKIATLADLQQLGFDSSYENWQVTTKINAGDARISGVEFSISQSLDALGRWGRYLKVFVNGTKLKLESSSNLADFGYFLPESANWGVLVNRKPITFRVNWNYRGWLKASPQATRGLDGFYYLKPAAPTLDASVDYQLRNRMFLFANAKNVFNTQIYHEMRGSETPEYAKRYSTQNFGVIVTAGIKGTF
jgi:iron complex outermembrane receptor protein